ncbi:hypothetical protein AKL17_2p0025 (plasmid) [Frigidibacter mobilis]|uniref:Uncharacterized protein n=1 Tax=Frigidibacter mobilis TaxID=1335048 RepID=A0A159Z9A2_9RHOB|nr:hypothetical protein AKL17_2p0025 [Frigidibacter mobilis]
MGRWHGVIFTDDYTSPLSYERVAIGRWQHLYTRHAPDAPENRQYQMDGNRLFFRRYIIKPKKREDAMPYDDKRTGTVAAMNPARAWWRLPPKTTDLPSSSCWMAGSLRPAMC